VLVTALLLLLLYLAIRLGVGHHEIDH
jgi:hypothetical protein